MYKQQAIANISNTIQLNNTTGLNNLSQKLEVQANKKCEALFNQYIIEANNVLISSLNEEYKQYSSNPQALEESFNKVHNKVINGIKNNDIKLVVEKNYLLQKENFLTKAQDNFDKETDFKTKQSILNNIDNLYNSATTYYENMYNGINDRFIFEEYKKELNKQLSTTGLYNQPLFTNRDIEEINKNFNVIQTQSFYNYINSTVENNPYKILDIQKEWEEQPQTTIEKYNLSQEDYNKQLNYIKQLARNIEEDYNNGSSSLKDVMNNTATTIDLTTRLNEFNIKDGNITNKKVEKVEDLIDFRNAVRQARNNKLIKDDKYREFLNKTDMALNNLIVNKKTQGNNFITLNGNEYIANRLNSIFNDNKYMYMDDRLFFYEKVYNVAQDKGIDLTTTDNKNIINDIISEVYKEYTKTKFIQLKEDTNAIIFGNNVIVPNNTQTTNKGMTTLQNAGYKKMRDKYGNEAYVRKNKDGSVEVR